VELTLRAVVTAGVALAAASAIALAPGGGLLMATVLRRHSFRHGPVPKGRACGLSRGCGLPLGLLLPP